MSGYSFKPGAAPELDIKGSAVYLELVAAFRWLFGDPDIQCSHRREIGNRSGYEFHPALAVNSVSAQPALVDLPGDSDRWHGDSCPHFALIPVYRARSKVGTGGIKIGAHRARSAASAPVVDKSTIYPDSRTAIQLARRATVGLMREARNAGM